MAVVEMTSLENLKKFVKQFIVKRNNPEEQIKATHTFSYTPYGMYNIPEEEYSTFMELYKKAIDDKFLLSVQEIPKGIGNLVISISSKQHTEFDNVTDQKILDLAKHFRVVLQENSKIPESSSAIVLQSPGEVCVCYTDYCTNTKSVHALKVKIEEHIVKHKETFDWFTNKKFHGTIRVSNQLSFMYGSSKNPKTLPLKATLALKENDNNISLSELPEECELIDLLCNYNKTKKNINVLAEGADLIDEPEQFNLQDVIKDARDTGTDYMIALWFSMVCGELYICTGNFGVIGKKEEESNPTLYVYQPAHGWYQSLTISILKQRIQQVFAPIIKADRIASKKIWQKVENNNPLTGIAQQLYTIYYKPEYECIPWGENRDVVNFKNVIYFLDSGEFRERNPVDYVKSTECLQYNYTPKSNTVVKQKVLEILFNISNNDIKTLLGILLFYGYGITGHTSEQKMLFCIGHSASNGKSTLTQIVEKVFPIYVKKMPENVFSKSNDSKRHKSIAIIKDARIVYVEELDKDKQNMGFIKNIVDGSSVTNEVMYGTMNSITIKFKIICFGNDDPAFEADNGGERRGLKVEATNRFLDGENYENNKHLKGVHKIIHGLVSLFDKNYEYKIAFAQLILEYSKKWYKNGLKDIPSEWSKNFKDLNSTNDVMKQFIENVFVITKENEDRISKVDFIHSYRNNVPDSKNIQWSKILNEIKRLQHLGFAYSPTCRAKGEGKGCIIGIKEKDDDNPNPINEGGDSATDGGIILSTERTPESDAKEKQDLQEVYRIHGCADEQSQEIIDSEVIDKPSEEIIISDYPPSEETDYDLKKWDDLFESIKASFRQGKELEEVDPELKKWGDDLYESIKASFKHNEKVKVDKALISIEDRITQIGDKLSKLPKTDEETIDPELNEQCNKLYKSIKSSLKQNNNKKKWESINFKKDKSRNDDFEWEDDDFDTDNYRQQKSKTNS
jgi:hypothetical protein